MEFVSGFWQVGMFARNCIFDVLNATYKVKVKKTLAGVHTSVNIQAWKLIMHDKMFSK